MKRFINKLLLLLLLSEHRFLVRVSYLEIYNEEVRDLLGSDQTSRLEVKERPDTGVYVKDLSAFSVHNADDMDRIMNVGNKNSESYIFLIFLHVFAEMVVPALVVKL